MHPASAVQDRNSYLSTPKTDTLIIKTAANDQPMKWINDKMGPVLSPDFLFSRRCYQGS